MHARIERGRRTRRELVLTAEAIVRLCGGGSAGIARALDTLIDAASAEAKWEPPSDDEVEEVRSTLRAGVDRHKREGGWAARKDLRSMGHGKGSRPRGGGARAKWMSKWHRLKKQGMTWADFVKANPEPPKSEA